MVSRKVVDKCNSGIIVEYNYMRLGHNYFIFITNKASLLEYDILVKDNHPRQQTST